MIYDAVHSAVACVTLHLRQAANVAGEVQERTQTQRLLQFKIQLVTKCLEVQQYIYRTEAVRRARVPSTSKSTVAKPYRLKLLARGDE